MSNIKFFCIILFLYAGSAFCVDGAEENCPHLFKTQPEIDGCVYGVMTVASGILWEARHTDFPEGFKLINNCGYECDNQAIISKWPELKTKACIKSCEDVVRKRFNTIM